MFTEVDAKNQGINDPGTDVLYDGLRIRVGGGNDRHTPFFASVEIEVSLTSPGPPDDPETRGLRKNSGPQASPSSSRSIKTNACPEFTVSSPKYRPAGKLPCSRKVTNKGLPTAQ